MQKSIKGSTQTDGLLCLYGFSLNKDSDFARSQMNSSACKADLTAEHTPCHTTSPLLLEETRLLSTLTNPVFYPHARTLFLIYKNLEKHEAAEFWHAPQNAHK